MQTEKLVYSIKETCKMVGLCDRTLRRMELAGTFPIKIRLGARKCAWLVSEVHEWLATRPRTDKL